ncbi:MAG: hypothetical protein H6741_32070 [Alphaproteobacteria bacterium]|nr:hypothetical protein [Alphaproteobacteria bacterium]
MRPLILAGLLLAAGCRNKDVSPADSEVGGGDDSSAPVDADGDGFDASEDCDDGDAAINPDSVELCDDVDNDCDDQVDEGALSTFYADADGDGYGDDGSAVEACGPEDGFVEVGGDCDDSDPAYNPSASEADCADPNDYNCDGSVGYADNDGDGFAACEDCDDADAAVNPDAEEACNEVDDDCDSHTDEGVTTTYWADTDGDGYGDVDLPEQACAQEAGTADNSEDCDDTDAAVHPAAQEVCDERDDDCDGLIDDADDSLDASTGGTFYADNDGDGYGDPGAASQACAQPSGAAEDSSDCDDTDSAVNPAAQEVCNGLDDDCDGDIDDDDASVDASTGSTFYADSDGDGYGDAGDSVEACDAPSGSVPDSSDCDDGDSAVHPAASESCDGADEDCDSLIDEGLLGSGASCGAESCLEALSDGRTADGSYYLDPDGDGVAELYDCDMTTDGGGWTRLLEWDRENDGDTEADFTGLLTENINDMGRFGESGDNLRWCDYDQSEDVLEYELPVEVPNGGEVLQWVHYTGSNDMERSGTWLYVEAGGSDVELLCVDNVDTNEPYYSTAERAWLPGFQCSVTNDLNWTWSQWTQISAGAQVESWFITSFHKDGSGACGDTSRLYDLEVWVR